MLSAVLTNFGFGTANNTTSAPMPERYSRTSASGSEVAASKHISAPKRMLILRRNASGSLLKTVAPSLRARNVKRRPIGPCPMMNTTSPAAVRALRIALRHVFTGSTNVASSKVTLSGIRTIPRFTMCGITRTYCANPPPFGANPAVTPTFL